MTCWAFRDKETFKDHAIGVLECFRRNFSYIIPILSRRTNIDREKVRKAVEIAVAFHDIGKVSKHYSISASYYGHEYYSGYIVYKIISRCCDSEVKVLAALAAISHHQAMEGRGLDFIQSGSCTKLPHFELNPECVDDINEVAEAIGVEIPPDTLDMIKNITPFNVKDWFYSLKSRKFYLYPIVLGPLMVCDTYVAYAHRGDGRKNLLIAEYEKFIST